MNPSNVPSNSPTVTVEQFELTFGIGGFTGNESEEEVERVVEITVDSTQIAISANLEEGIEAIVTASGSELVDNRRTVRRMLLTQNLVIRMNIQIITTDPTIVIDTSDVQQVVTETVEDSAFTDILKDGVQDILPDIDIGIITSTVTNVTSPNSNAPSGFLTPSSMTTLMPSIDDFYDDVCFSPIATVMVNGKGRVMMKDLANGDDVLTMNGSYQTMYSMNHYHTSKETTFVQIKTNLELEQPLELSPKHLLYLVDNTNPVPASTIKVGDNVWTLKGRKEVLEVNMITRGGLYNPLTVDGTIVVNGIAASVYTTPSGKAHLQMEGVWSKMMNSLSFHDALHMISAPYRQYCTMVSIDLCNLHEKESAASSFMKTFFFSFFSNQNGFVKFIVASSYVLVFGTLANLTYFKVWFLLANAFAFFTILSKTTRTKKAAF